MNRRMFMGVLAGAALDPERLLWEPGKKLISIPAIMKPVLRVRDHWDFPLGWVEVWERDAGNGLVAAKFVIKEGKKPYRPWESEWFRLDDLRAGGEIRVVGDNVWDCIRAANQQWPHRHEAAG